MKTKKLFVFVRDAGDGSYHAAYTFNEAWVNEMEAKLEDDFDEEWMDGDGFHYDVLNVPEECTLKSLGIYYDCAEDR